MNIIGADKSGGGNANLGSGIIVNSNSIAASAGGGIYNYNSSPVLTNVSITGNTVTLEGGGIYNYFASPVISSVSISGNTAIDGGGIANISSSSPVLTNVRITGNTAYDGSGIYNASSSPILTNVTISGNTATTNGGGISNFNSSPQIRNTIIYGNSSGIVNEYTGSTPMISYSLVQGSTDVTNGNIDGSTDPKFVSPVAAGLSTGGDYRLQPTSPLINAGSNVYFDAGQTPDLSSITTDLDGNPRIYDGTTEMGAYELQPGKPITIQPDVNGVVYVSPTGNGNLSGDSWANASNDLQLSINAAGVHQVWVAAGTYLPVRRADALTVITPNDRNNAFVLEANVKIYGGFAGNETALTQRDSTRTTNNTILSGDIGTVGDNSDNACNVVISAGDVGTAELNGFTISGGNANINLYTTVNSQSIPNSNGGGIITESSSPFISNVTITGNTNLYNGGGIYNYYSSPILTNVIIAGNTSTNSSGNGGGICNYSSSPVLTNVSITGNTAASEGGGIYNNSSSPVLTNVIISGNTAANGGGIFNYVSYSSPFLTNVIISGNTASSQGGGIYNQSSSPVLTNVTISGNTAISGGGIINYSSSPKIRNTIIYGNNTGIKNNGSSIPIISNSLVQGSTQIAQ